MITNLLVIGACLAVVIVGADYFVRAASSMARRLGVPPLLIGVTIVAFGTSAPELMVSIQSAIEGAPGIALGNIVGSNIANVLLVLGLGAAIQPISCTETGLRRNTSVMLAATAVFVWAAYAYQAISFPFGFVLAFGLLAFLAMAGSMARAGQGDGFTQELLDHQEESHSWIWIAVRLVGGIAGLLLGARFLVANAVELAEALQVRDELIGLTVIAIGTSLPELVTVVVAAARRHAAIALGGIVGSNIFNLLAVGAAVGLAGGGAFSSAALAFDIPVMLIATGALALYIFARRDIRRVGGVIFTVAYVAYLVMVVRLEGQWPA